MSYYSVPRRRTCLGAFAFTLACMFLGCGRENPPPKAVPPAKPALGRTETTYELRGEVLGLDPKTSSVTIRHEKIPEFMPAMTMPFPLQDPSEMAHLKVGDTVQGSLWVAREKGNVTEFKLSDLAVVSRPLTLKVADGEASLSSSPRRLEPDQEVPDFTMTTQNGTPLRLSDLRGKVVVLTFVYTQCPQPDFCPLQDKKFSELADRLAAVPKRAEQVRLLSVSFDPEHDTPEILEKHAAMRGAKPPLWTYAVASHPELAKVAGPLGLTYGPRPNEIMHNLTTAIIDQRGRLVKIESGKSWTPADLFKTIYSQIPDSRE